MTASTPSLFDVLLPPPRCVHDGCDELAVYEASNPAAPTYRWTWCEQHRRFHTEAGWMPALGIEVKPISKDDT